MKPPDKTLEAMERSPRNVRVSSLATLCEQYFGAPRAKGTSHHVYRTPWAGDPRVHIQKGKSGKAKTYQVKQVLAAIRKLREQDHD
jgi:hypothetical protein